MMMFSSLAQRKSKGPRSRPTLDRQSPASNGFPFVNSHDRPRAKPQHRHSHSERAPLMASLYRPRITTWKMNGKCRTPDGRRVTKDMPGAVRVDGGPSRVWYGKFTLPSGEVRRVKLTTDKS